MLWGPCTLPCSGEDKGKKWAGTAMLGCRNDAEASAQPAGQYQAAANKQPPGKAQASDPLYQVPWGQRRTRSAAAQALPRHRLRLRRLLALQPPSAAAGLLAAAADRHPRCRSVLLGRWQAHVGAAGAPAGRHTAALLLMLQLLVRARHVQGLAAAEALAHPI